MIPGPRRSAGASWLRRLLGAVIVATVAACQSPAASPASTGSTPSASPDVQPSSAATATPSRPPSGLFHLVGSAPVIARADFPGRGAVLPGAIAVDEDGGYHAWAIAFGDPGTQEIHYLTSQDAISWHEVEDPSLAELSAGFGNPGAMPTSVLQTDGGWVMYLTGTRLDQPAAWEIYRAAASAPGGPWTRAVDPVVERGPAGAWDAGVLDFPTVFPTATGYGMLYSALPEAASDAGSVGLATSPDGITWTKAGAPVIEPGFCGGFDTRAIHQPRVLADENGLTLAYAGYGDGATVRPGIGLANSLDDGVTWACEWPANALTASELPPGDGVHTIALFQRGLRQSLLVEWLADGGTDVWLMQLGPREP